jgi:hypothetical protein
MPVGAQKIERTSAIQHRSKHGFGVTAMSPNEPKLLVSVVVPVYAGANFLDELAERLDHIRTTWAADEAPVGLAEVIFVDDEAVDDSPSMLDRLAAESPWIRVLRLSRNYGQHPATIAGILYSSGDWVVTLDEDLQHPPEKLEPMLRLAVSQGLDVVYASPQGAIHESAIRDLGSVLFKRLIGLLAGDRNVALFNSFRVIRGSIARAASSVCGHETYFDVALSWFTRRVGTLAIEMKDHRVIGGAESGYSIRRLLSHARRLLMSTQVKMLRGGALVGVVTMAAGFVFAGVIIAKELLAPGSFGPKGWGSLMVANMVFGGMALFLISAALEYLSVLVLRAQGKPVFFAVDRTSDSRVAHYLERRID